MKTNRCTTGIIKIISLVILFITSPIIAQSHAEYYPLQIGNKWFYKETDYEGDLNPTPPLISYHSREVVGDTIMANGIKYYVIGESGGTHYERYDTLSNEIIYYSNSGSQAHEERIYSLNYIKNSTVVWNSSFGGMTFQINIYQQAYSDTATIMLLGSGFEEQGISFKRYIGINYNSISYDFGYNNSNLIGYRINGKEWGQLTSVNVNNNITPEYRLEQNYPNPFNPVTIIEFSIAKSSWVRLNIYNALGQLVSTILDKQLSPGRHKAVFNGSKFTSGIYFYQLITDNYKSTKKLILLK